MGAWGVHTFQNDSARDWVYDLEDSQGLTFIEESLDTALAQGEYLDSEEGSFALAAAETVACLIGRPPHQDLLTGPLTEWVKENPPEVTGDVLQKAVRAVDRVATPPSELLELWEQTELFQDWTNSLADLKRRLLN